MQNSGTRRGVHLQDSKTQGQNFAQNGNQKPLYNGPEASDLVTKNSTGMDNRICKSNPERPKGPNRWTQLCLDDYRCIDTI